MSLRAKHNSKSAITSVSTKIRANRLVLAAIGLILQFFTFAAAQTVDISIKTDPAASSAVEVSGKGQAEMNKLSFVLSAYGISDLGKRISDVRIYDGEGNSIAYKQFVPGEYVADRGFSSWKYRIDLAPYGLRSAAAHLSWITPARGIIMLDDVLPKIAQEGKNPDVNVRLELPARWRSFPAGISVKAADLSATVIYLGESLRGGPIALNDTTSMIFDGDWYFSRADAIASANEIYGDRLKLFGKHPSVSYTIALMKFPGTVRPGEWEAETRGHNITIISSDMPFQSQSVQRLHEQLRHEMFHLWIPNGVNLGGNYDWFYEGFALYQSLRMGVAANRIRFDDLLDTMSRALTTDRSHSGGMSLIEASRNRFGGANSTVYARGMVVAFLCDLALLDKSKGKRSVENILREIFKKHHNSPYRMDGNEAVLAAFAAYPELKPIVDRYVLSGDQVSADEYLRMAGIASQTTNSVTTLSVLPKPNSRQKDLLDKLGYNTWRKLANISK